MPSRAERTGWGHRRDGAPIALVLISCSLQLQPSGEQHSRVVLIVEIVRPITDSMCHDLHDFIEWFFGITGQQLRQTAVSELDSLRILALRKPMRECAQQISRLQFD